MIIHADILKWAKEYDGPPFHALLCDPPYHLTNRVVDWAGFKDPAQGGRGKPVLTRNNERGFMNAKWDGGSIAFEPETWAALAQHLYPGAFGMAFSGSRGWHRMAVAIEDAGLIIHPTIFCWAYGSGFPKATRIDTQVDRQAGATRAKVGTKKHQPKFAAAELGYREKDNGYNSKSRESFDVTAPATELAAAWAGHRYGLQALKPSIEPIIVFQRPYTGRPVECITATGAGALWIDGARIKTDDDLSKVPTPPKGWKNSSALNGTMTDDWKKGRWPANFALTHHPACERVGVRRVRGTNTPGQRASGASKSQHIYSGGWGDDIPNHYNAPDGRETIADWRCVESCPVQRLGEQSGELQSGSKHGFYDKNSNGIYGDFAGCEQHADGSIGTAARFFHQSDWMAERLEAAGIAEHYKCLICGCKEQKRGIMNEKQHTTEDICDPVTSAENLLSQPNEPADSALMSVPDMQRHGNAGKSENRPIPATNAENSLKSSPETSGSIAPPNAPDSQVAQIARDARFVANLCDSCAIGIARSLVATLQGSDPESPLGAASMPARKKQILLHSLALFVASRASSDTTLTIADLSMFFGFVSLAIENNTPAKTAPLVPQVLYVSKASRGEREAGLDPRQIALLRMAGEEIEDFADAGNDHATYGEFKGVPGKHTPNNRRSFPETTVDDGRQTPIDNAYLRGETKRRNTHPTIKPIALTRWLATLLLPPAMYAPRRLLVPFAGAGSEMVGAMLAGWEDVTGIELEADHVAIAEARLAYWQQRRWELLDPAAPITARTDATIDGQMDMFLEDI